MFELDAMPADPDGVTMFVDRARLLRPDFEPTADSRRRIVDIVQRLDGIPLAIELAAARVGLLGLSELSVRLGARFDLLTAPGQSHPSLHAAIERSWQVLAGRERRVLAECSVFRGGFSLAAAERVTTGDLGRLAHNRGRAEQALDHYQAAQALFAACGDLRAQAHLSSLLSDVANGQARDADALTHGQRAIERFARLGDPDSRAPALYVEGGLHFRAGRLGDARRAWDQAIALMAQLGDPRFEGYARCNLGILLCELARYHSARLQLDAAHQLFARTGYERLAAIVVGYLGALEHRLANPDAAQARYRDATENLGGALGSYFDGVFRSCRATALAQLGRGEESRLELARAGALLGASGDPRALLAHALHGHAVAVLASPTPDARARAAAALAGVPPSSLKLGLRRLLQRNSRLPARSRRRGRARRRLSATYALFTRADATRLTADALGHEGAAALDASELCGREQDDGLTRQLELGLVGLVQLLHRELLDACGKQPRRPTPDTMGMTEGCRHGAASVMNATMRRPAAAALSAVGDDRRQSSANRHARRCVPIAMMKRVLWSVALVIAAGTVPDCVCRRDATVRPELVIRVVDASGQPVAGAHVMVVHQTMPHSALRDWWPVETGADGTVAVTELSRDETIAPFCMHGVPGHGFFVCAGKPGAGVEIVRVRGERQLELRLHDDDQDDCWNRNAYRAGGNLGWTLTPDELQRGREHVDRLPADGHWPDAAPR